MKLLMMAGLLLASLSTFSQEFSIKTGVAIMGGGDQDQVADLFDEASYPMLAAKFGDGVDVWFDNADLNIEMGFFTNWTGTFAGFSLIGDAGYEWQTKLFNFLAKDKAKFMVIGPAAGWTSIEGHSMFAIGGNYTFQIDETAYINAKYLKLLENGAGHLFQIGVGVVIY